MQLCGVALGLFPGSPNIPQNHAHPGHKTGWAWCCVGLLPAAATVFPGFLLLQQPIRYIVNLNSFIGIFGMPGSGKNHFGVSISNLKQRSTFSVKCFLPRNVVADLYINLLASPLCNKICFLLIELTHIDIISTAKEFNANDVFIWSPAFKNTNFFIF